MKLFALLLLAASAYGQSGIVTSVNGSGPGAVTLTASQVGAVPANSYLGLVGIGTQWPEYSVSGTWEMIGFPTIIRTNLPALGQKLVMQNAYGLGESDPSTATYKVSIEYPLGVITQCTFSGAATITIAGKAFATTDWCGPAVPLGATEVVRLLRTGTNVLYSYFSAGLSPTLSGFEFGTGTPDDKTGGGSITSGTGNFYSPAAVIGITYAPSVCLSGDSRMVGRNDGATDFSLALGEVARFIGPSFAYTNLAVSGETISSALTNYALRSQLFQYCSFVVDEYGINDLTGGATTTVLTANRTAFAALTGGKPVWGTTLPSITSSTDNWATLGNQTSTTDARPFNALVRTGVAGEIGFFDVARAVDPSDLGKWPVSPFLNVATGTANFATADGIHEDPRMNQIIAQTLGYVTNWIKR